MRAIACGGYWVSRAARSRTAWAISGDQTLRYHVVAVAFGQAVMELPQERPALDGLDFGPHGDWPWGAGQGGRREGRPARTAMRLADQQFDGQQIPGLPGQFRRRVRPQRSSQRRDGSAREGRLGAEVARQPRRDRVGLFAGRA